MRGNQMLIVFAILREKHCALEIDFFDFFAGVSSSASLLLVVSRMTSIPSRGPPSSWKMNVLPFAEDGGDGDVAAQQVGQAFADRQSCARAAEAARRGSICLRERLEEARLRFGRHADARVGDFKKMLWRK